LLLCKAALSLPVLFLEDFAVTKKDFAEFLRPILEWIKANHERPAGHEPGLLPIPERFGKGMEWVYYDRLYGIIFDPSQLVAWVDTIMSLRHEIGLNREFVPLGRGDAERMLRTETQAQEFSFPFLVELATNPVQIAELRQTAIELLQTGETLPEELMGKLRSAVHRTLTPLGLPESAASM